jgi:hypothetical protein
MFYTRAYQHYGAIAADCSDAVILKCDDDIVYFDLDKLGEYVSFWRSRDEFFMISANVVNNGVCAFFQQRSGVIPREDDAFELPPNGLCGTLWSDGAKAERLHRLFLNRPARFTAAGGDPIVWNHRISINFVALLGKDLGFIPDIMFDDEHRPLLRRSQASEKAQLHLPAVRRFPSVVLEAGRKHGRAGNHQELRRARKI